MAIRFFDMFAGIGGFRSGLEAVGGFECIGHCEIDKKANQAYNAIYQPKGEIYFEDATKIDTNDLPDIDLICAGFPCQSFSVAGKRLGFRDDTRGTLFFEVARIAEAKRPPLFLLENVPGLLSHDGGRTFAAILHALDGLGYGLEWQVLNSKDFGVPQNRERIFLVCFREDVAPEDFKFPEPTGEKVSIRQIMDDAPISPKYYLSDVYLETLRRHRAHHESLGHGFGYEIKDLDGIASAIVCGGMGRERNLIIDHRPHSMKPVTHIKGEINKEDVRKMTPREWARLQGFPDNYKLPLSDVHLYKQFGNSVTVPVIAAIAKEIKKVLDGQGK